MAFTVDLTVANVEIKVVTTAGIGKAIAIADFNRLTKHALMFLSIANN